MSVMAASIVRELGLMHLVSGLETYKTASSAVTQALGRIEEVPIKVGEVQCSMTFMVVDTDRYDIMLGLDLLIKIGAIVDIEQGLIQVRKGPGANVEILPLIVVNLVQRSDLSTYSHDGEDIREHMLGNTDAGQELSFACQKGAKGKKVILEADSDCDSSESSDERTLLVGSDERLLEFVDAEFEDLVNKEGPL